MSKAHVRPPVEALTEAEARHLLAAGLLKPTHEQGPAKVALKLGCDEKTVRRARDKETTLRLDYSWNTLLADRHALDPLAAHYGFRLSPLDPEKIADLHIPTIVTRFQLEMSVALEDGRLDPSELAKMKPAIEALEAMIDDLRQRMSLREAA